MRCLLLIIFGLLACSSWSRKGSTEANARDIMESIRRGASVYITDVDIKEDIDFTGLKGLSLGNDSRQISVDVPLVFEGCSFEGVLNARGTKTTVRFTFPVLFKNCTFRDTVSFRSAVFEQEVVFKDCIFQQDFDARATIFQSLASIGENTFEGDAYFQSAVFDRKASYFKSTFQETANFQSAYFKDIADFGAAVFEGYTELSQVHFNRGAFFSYLDSRDRLLINHSIFRDRVDFIKIKLKGSIEFRGNTFYLEPRIQWIDGTYEMKEENNTVLKKEPIEMN